MRTPELLAQKSDALYQQHTTSPPMSHQNLINLNLVNLNNYNQNMITSVDKVLTGLVGRVEVVSPQHAPTGTVHRR